MIPQVPRTLRAYLEPRPRSREAALLSPAHPLLPPFSLGLASTLVPTPATDWPRRNWKEWEATGSQVSIRTLFTQSVVISRVRASERESVAGPPLPRPRDHRTEDAPPGDTRPRQDWVFFLIINKNSTLNIYIYNIYIKNIYIYNIYIYKSRGEIKFYNNWNSKFQNGKCTN